MLLNEVGVGGVRERHRQQRGHGHVEGIAEGYERKRKIRKEAKGDGRCTVCVMDGVTFYAVQIKDMTSEEI